MIVQSNRSTLRVKCTFALLTLLFISVYIFCLSVIRELNLFYFSYYLLPFYISTPQQIAAIIYTLK